MAQKNEARIRCLVKLFVYKFVCDDCGMRWTKNYTEDHGESYARSSIRHRCSRRLVESSAQ